MSEITQNGESVLASGRAQRRAASSAGRGAVLGGVFLMATSAIGPGFLTQTSVFTVQMGASFAFAIVVSILVDVAIQLNVWRVLGISGKRANELGNAVVPGLGWAMAVCVFIGGAVFNIGNIAGTGLGLNALAGIDPTLGGALSAVVAVAVFLSKRAGVALDRIVVVLGGLMIVLMAYVAVVSGPPVGAALRNAVFPEEIDVLVITTLIGGTVGGYITFAGAHRMIDANITGPESVKEINSGSIMGIIVTGVMRLLLFLAVLGVVATGVNLSPDNTAADAFFQAAGEFGVRAFGVVLWAAGLTSVIGASYTSVSFVTTQATGVRTRNIATVAFIACCAVAFVLLDAAPQALLIFAGAFNGLILPVGFAVVLWVAWRRPDLMRGYRYPRWLLVLGVAVWVLTIFLGVRSLSGIAQLW